MATTITGTAAADTAEATAATDSCRGVYRRARLCAVFPTAVRSKRRKSPICHLAMAEGRQAELREEALRFLEM